MIGFRHLPLLVLAATLGLAPLAPALSQTSAATTETPTTAATTEPVASAATGPAEVQTGAYVLRLSNVSQKDGTFDVDMWVWFRWTDPALKPYESFELANGQISSRSEAVVSQDAGANYTTVRVQATIFHEFDVSRYPMDDHTITLEFEDENLDNAHLRYVADEGIALDPAVKVAGWDVALGQATVADHSYATTYGSRASGAAAGEYSRLIVPVTLKRTTIAPLFKDFWISGLSVLLGLLAFRVRATDLDARFGLGVGSVFAASANAFVISDSLPQTTIVTLAEQINFLAIGTIFFSVFMSIASLRLCYAGKDEASERLDLRALIVIGTAYVLANIFVVTTQL
jgi:hypothetical protein